MTKVEFLQALAKGWFGNSQQHAIQAQLLKQRGFGKLADEIMWRDWSSDVCSSDLLSPFQRNLFSLHCLDFQAEDPLTPRRHVGQPCG